jgi:hypothetical protein
MRCANATNLHRKSGGSPTIAFVMVVQETTLTLGSLAMWKLKAVVGALPLSFSSQVRFGEPGAPVLSLVFLGGTPCSRT